MWILYNKRATLYKYSRNATTGISDYSSTWIDFGCNIQPLSTKDWLEWWVMLKQKKMYCDYNNITVWDKVVVEWVSYIIENFEKRDGTKRRFNKAFISESEWS